MYKHITMELKEARNPFKDSSLQLLGHLSKIWFANIRNRKSRGKAKIARALFVYLTKLGLKTFGKVKFRIKGREIIINFDESNIQFGAVYFESENSYEAEISCLIDVIMPSQGVFFDVGSNWGYFSLYVASKPGFKGKIFAFEPNPESFNDLITTIKQVGLEDIIHAQNIGGSFIKQKIAVRKSLRSGNFNVFDLAKSDKTGVKINLDRLDSGKLPMPDLIKIDTEGSEGDVLEGCTRFLKLGKSSVIFESTLYKDNPLKTLKPFLVLEKFGYKFFYIGYRQNFDSKDVFVARSPEDNMELKEILLTHIEYQQRFLLEERCNILARHSSTIQQ